MSVVGTLDLIRGKKRSFIGRAQKQFTDPRPLCVVVNCRLLPNFLHGLSFFIKLKANDYIFSSEILQ